MHTAVRRVARTVTVTGQQHRPRLLVGAQSRRPFIATPIAQASETAPATTTSGAGATANSVQTTTSSSSTLPTSSSAPKREGRFVTATRALWQRITSFVVGVALGGTIAYVKLHNDVWDSTVQMEQSVHSLKEDIVRSNQDLRKRVAALEHELDQPGRRK